MRRLLSAAFVAVMLMLVASARAQVKFGIKGGLNVTSMKFNADVLDKSNSEGFYFGPTVKFQLPVVGLGVDAAALYDQRSSKITAEEGNEQITRDEETLTQRQISIPVNLRYDVGLGETASIYFFAGPQFAFNVGGKIKEIDWRWKDTNFSVNVGLGVMLLNHLQLNTNYNIACGKTGELGGSSVFTTLKKGFNGKSNTWQLGLAYYF